MIKVVDVSDPTSMTEIGSLDVAANLATYCTVSDCIYEWMDFAGRHNPCGYGSVLKFVTNYGTFNASVGSRGAFVGPNGNFNAISYAATNGPADATMTSPEACQLLCQQTAGCGYYSYEFEYQDWMSPGLSVHECYLKAAYRQSQVPSGMTLSDCNHYTIWEPGPDWTATTRTAIMPSGPAVCAN